MADAVSTYGWDVVFATRSSVVNAGLADPGPQPLDETVLHGGVSVRAQGSTGRWQLAVGGSGALVNFTVPCASLALSTADKKVSFSDGQFEVQGSLALTPAAHGPGSRHELTVVAGPGALTVLTATFPQADFVSYAAYGQAAFQAWLNGRGSFPYVLATVDLAGAGQVGLDRALTPVTADYAYVDTVDGEGVLGVLGMLTQDDAATGQLLQEVSPDAVSETDTALLVSASVLQRLLDGAAAAVTLPGSTGSTSPVEAPGRYPVTQARPA